jgi:hypothetical protein
VPRPELVDDFQAYVDVVKAKFFPESAIAVAWVKGGHSLEQPDDSCFVAIIAFGLIALGRSRLAEDLASPTFGDRKMASNVIDRQPPTRRA